MDEEILSILGIDSVEDLTQEEYLSLLMEASVRAQMKGSAISKDALIRITEEIKRVRSESKTAIAKGTSREEARKRKVNPQKVFASAPKPVQKTGGTAGQKLLAAGKEKQAEDEKETRALTVIIPSALNTLAAGVNNVVKVMVKDLTMEKKQSEAERKAAENLGRAEKEEDSEKKVEEKTNNFFKGFKPPQLGIFDRLKNFVTNVALGGLLTWLTKPENQDKVKKFTDFIEDHGYKILVGIAGLLALGIGAQIIGFIGTLISLGAVLIPLLKVIAAAALVVGAIELGARLGEGIKNYFQGGEAGKQFDEKAKKEAFDAAGILADTKGSSVANPDGTQMYINLYDLPEGDPQKLPGPSLMGRKATGGENRNARVPLNLYNEKHRKYIEKNFGKDRLAEMDAAHEAYTKRIEAKDKVKESMKAEWDEITGKQDWDFMGGFADLASHFDEDKRAKIEELNERYGRALTEVYDKGTAELEKRDKTKPITAQEKQDAAYQLYLKEKGLDDDPDSFTEFINQYKPEAAKPEQLKPEAPTKVDISAPEPPTETLSPTSFTRPSAGDDPQESSYDRQLRLMKEAMTKVDVTVVPVKKDKAGVGAGARGGQNIIDKFSVVDQTNVSIAAVAGVYNSPIPRA